MAAPARPHITDVARAFAALVKDDPRVIGLRERDQKNGTELFLYTRELTEEEDCYFMEFEFTVQERVPGYPFIVSGMQRDFEGTGYEFRPPGGAVQVLPEDR